jgi:Arc/MetJ-type ribon-helix-helix transcriptional regulator
MDGIQMGTHGEGRGILPETEKITINLGAVDLGQIDLLVDQGFYSNRTDFIRTAIRNQITAHSLEIKQITTDKYLAMGVVKFNRSKLEEMQRTGRKADVKLIGLLQIADDVPPELAQAVFKSVKVFGIVKASRKVKEILNSLE